MKKAVLFAILSMVAATTPALAAGAVKANSGGNGNGGGSGKSGGGVAPAPRACALSDVSATAFACSGFFAGNLLSGNPGDFTAQQSALASIGLNWNGNFSEVTKISSLTGRTTVDFSIAEQNPVSKIYGDTWIGVHFGNSAGLDGNATGFWKLDAGLDGLVTFVLNISKGSSGAVLYQTGSAPPPSPMDAVPEPASWAMLIAGFGLVGAVTRRGRVTVGAA